MADGDLLENPDYFQLNVIEMPAPNQQGPILWTYQILRWFFTAVLLATSIGKLLDNRGFASVIASYQLAIPETLLLPLALSVSLIELGIGTRLLLARYQLQNAWALVAIHSSYFALATITFGRGIDLQNCGCFGVFLARPLTFQTLLEDAFLTLLSLCFVWTVRASGKA